MKTKIEFNARDYEAAHGRAPKGRAYWAFTCRHYGINEPHFIQGERSFSEAKREMDRYVRETLAVEGNHGDPVSVEVCP
jgi:hypothetical protein